MTFKNNCRRSVGGVPYSGEHFVTHKVGFYLQCLEGCHQVLSNSVLLCHSFYFGSSGISQIAIINSFTLY